MAKELKYLTINQWAQLGTMGKELYEYWINFRPRFSKRLAEKNEFWTTLQAEADEYDRMFDELLIQGLHGWEAAEILRAQWMETPPEPGT